jgi:hypothetical protein
MNEFWGCAMRVRLAALLFCGEGTTIVDLEIPLDPKKGHRPRSRMTYTGPIWPGKEWIFNGNWFREVV